MNNKNKILLVCMIAIVIVIIIIGMMLKMLNTSNKNETDVNSNTEFEKKDTYIAKENMEEVENRNKYFAIQKIVNSYFSYIEEMNGDKPYSSLEKYKSETLEAQRKEGLKALRLMSYEYYKSKSDDVIIKDGKEYSKYNIEIKNMYIIEKSSRINIYFIELLVGGKETKLIVKTDSNNMTFSIYPNSNKENINSIADNEIEKNDYNQFNYINIKDDYMAKLYFEDYKTKMANNIEEAYSLLETNYASKRFGSLKSFKDYAQNLINENIEIAEYLVNSDNGYKEYICKDQYGNLYIFKETAIMKYTLILDTYTLEQKKFNEEYRKATNEKKVMMNIDKFFQMINAKDYKAAYSLLNQEFKEKNFKTEQQFENYMKQKMFSYNDVEYVKYSDEISAIYQYSLVIKNRLDTKQTKKFNVIMQLKEGTNFVMSFSID